MRDLDLQPCQPRPWRASLTEADGREHHIPDLFGQDFTASAPGRKMVGDITYIPTWQGWLYLATVIDCHTKMVIGYAMAADYKTPLIQAALHHAADRTELEPDAIFTPTEAATILPMISPRPSLNSTYATRSAAPESATTTPWPNRSSPL